MCIGDQHCLIPTPYLQRQKYSYFPTDLWDVSTAAASRSKNERVHFPIRQKCTPQPLVVLPTHIVTEPTQNWLILKFLQCLMVLSGLGQEQLIKGSCYVICSLQVGWWIATGGGSLLFCVGRQWLQRGGCSHFFSSFSFLKSYCLSLKFPPLMEIAQFSIAMENS